MSLKLAIPLTPILSTAMLATAAHADTTANDLMPLDGTSLALSTQSGSLQTIENNINNSLIAARTPNTNSLNLSELPVVREFVDTNGNLGLKMDPSISIQVVNSLDGGGYAVGLKTQF